MIPGGRLTASDHTSHLSLALPGSVRERKKFVGGSYVMTQFLICLVGLPRYIWFSPRLVVRRFHNVSLGDQIHPRKARHASGTVTAALALRLLYPTKHSLANNCGESGSFACGPALRRCLLRALHVCRSRIPYLSFPYRISSCTPSCSWFHHRCRRFPYWSLHNPFPIFSASLTKVDSEGTTLFTVHDVASSTSME